MKEKANDRTKIVEALKQEPSFLITSHDSPCGDAIGSELAMRLLLERLGKEVVIINSDTVPANMLFLPGADKVSSEFAPGKLPQTAIVLDCANLNRIGRHASAIGEFDNIINIDHHISNDYFGTLNHVDVECPATGEMLFPLFEELVGGVKREEAICLYTSLISDTGSFQHAGTKPRTHEIAAHLLDKGVDPSLVARQLYGNFSLSNRRLLGIALSNLQLSSDGKIAWLKVTREMYHKTGAKEKDAHDFIDHVYSMKDVLVSVLLRELDDNSVKVSFRSNLLDVNRVAQVFGGGGHPQAAGCTVKGPITEAEKKVVETIQKFLEKTL